MKTINMTREGLSAISSLIVRSPYLKQILNGKSHFTENCEWDFDVKSNRNTYRLHLPKDKLDILKFLFDSELHQKTTESFWSSDCVDFRRKGQGYKMIKRILEQI